MMPVHAGEDAAAVSERARDGLRWLQTEGEGWTVAFSTRHDGVSTGAFATLNIGLSVGDAPSAVLENRSRLVAVLGFRLDDLVVPGQVHGTRVAAVDERHRGRGARDRDTVVHATDALATTTPRLPLVVSFADCVPVLIAARGARGRIAIALVHAGWRGMLAGVVGATAEHLARLGTLSAAVVGPSIGPCCFTDADDVGRRFDDRFPGSRRDGSVDLWACAEAELAACDVPRVAIVNPRLCTSCDRRFYSHRRDGGRTGRQAAVAWIG